MNFQTKVSRSVLLLFALSAMLGLFAGCNRSENPSNPSARSGAQGYFKTPFQDESQFVVEAIATDIAEMLYFAHNHKAPEPKTVTVEARENGGTRDAPSFDITIQVGKAPAIQTKVAITGPIWSAAVYADLTRAVAASLQFPSPSTAAGDDLSVLDDLTDGSAETIARDDVVVSGNLEKDFANPALHEQAAALLGAFALRENAGAFYDIRLPLSRMTAHLAMAQFLAGEHPPGAVGQVADCMILTLMNDEVAALTQIEKLDAASGSVATWARTLRAYNTLDFRPLDASTNVPGIEQVAWFAAYSGANSRSVAWRKIGEGVAKKPDFCRIGASLGYSVEMGNGMLQIWLPLEMKEIEDVFQQLNGGALKQSDLVDSLNSDPDRCFIQHAKGAHVRVIGWGLWALQLQHHLCLAITTDVNSLYHKLGLGEDGWAFAQKCEESFGGLRFYPFVRRISCTNEAGYRKSIDQGWAFQQEFPHLTPMYCMDYLAGTVSFAQPYRPLPNPHCNEWTSHNPLPGTAYDARNRLDFPSFTGGGGQSERVLKAHEIAPYDIALCRFIGRSYGNNWTYEKADAVYGKLLPYSAVAAAAIANSQAGDPAQYEQTMETAAKWDPSYYGSLANYQLNHGQTNEAMKTYENEERSNPDAIEMAAVAVARVKYYLAKGQKRKAKEVADFGAAVYSFNGLESMGVYMEETGDLAQAFDWFAKTEERYQNADALLSFCCRHAASSGDAELDKKIHDRLQVWYKQRKPAKLSDFSGPPKRGVALNDPGSLLENYSLKQGDVIVAARGVRVENITQLTFARDMDPAPSLTIIYWQGDSYREKTIPLNDEHRFGATLQNYPPSTR